MDNTLAQCIKGVSMRSMIADEVVEFVENYGEKPRFIFMSRALFNLINYDKQEFVKVMGTFLIPTDECREIQIATRDNDYFTTCICAGRQELITNPHKRSNQ